jgi:hypothetical protein
VVFISENAGWARNFFASQKQIFAGILGGFQKNLLKNGGKRPSQTALTIVNTAS